MYALFRAYEQRKVRQQAGACILYLLCLLYLALLSPAHADITAANTGKCSAVAPLHCAIPCIPCHLPASHTQNKDWGWDAGDLVAHLHHGLRAVGGLPEHARFHCLYVDEVRVPC